MNTRKICTFVEDTFSEAGRTAPVPLRKVAVVAVIENPYAGRYADDLSELVAGSIALGTTICDLARRAMGKLPIESYGKAALVGLAGEQEHAVALLTTVYGDVMREAAGGGKAWIPSITKRAAPGATLDVPLAHKDALFVRSHYDGMSLTLHDSPLPDEIAVICCFANRGRLNHRVGGLEASRISGEDGLR